MVIDKRASLLARPMLKHDAWRGEVHGWRCRRPGQNPMDLTPQRTDGGAFGVQAGVVGCLGYT